MPFNWLLFKNGFCARLKSSVCSQFWLLFRHLVLSTILPCKDLTRRIILKDSNFYLNFWTIFRCKISIFNGESEFSNKVLKVLNEKWEFFNEQLKKFMKNEKLLMKNEKNPMKNEKFPMVPQSFPRSASSVFKYFSWIFQ